MDGIHDLGGKQGFGEVHVEPDEPAFHERWEAGVFTMSGAGRLAGAWTNTDRFRHSIERIDPVAYLTHGYYGRWLGGIETLLVEAGIVDRAEITARAIAAGAGADDLIASRPAASPAPIGEPPPVEGARRETNASPGFSIGDLVRTRATGTMGHTRLPAYARGRNGTVIACHGAWVYPDSNAHGRGEQPQHLYTVRFAGSELWSDGDSRVNVSLDLFEPYMLPARDHD